MPLFFKTVYILYARTGSTHGIVLVASRLALLATARRLTGPPKSRPRRTMLPTVLYRGSWHWKQVSAYNAENKTSTASTLGTFETLCCQTRAKHACFGKRGLGMEYTLEPCPVSDLLSTDEDDDDDDFAAEIRRETLRQYQRHIRRSPQPTQAPPSGSGKGMSSCQSNPNQKHASLFWAAVNIMAYGVYEQCLVSM